MKVRIKFRKLGLMKFIGHLDMMRGWQKIFRRSGIPIAYSEGYNPHQVFSIAAPLAVGTTSEGEYLDLRLKEEGYDLELLVSQVNDVCPEGVEVLEAVELVGKQTSGMAACLAADYVISLSEELYEKLMPKSRLEEFFDQESIIVKKKNKKGRINDLDIKKGIVSYELPSDESLAFKVRLATGSSLNIKPELLMNAIFDYCGVELKTFTLDRFYNIHRLDIFRSLDPLCTLTEGLS